MAVEKKKWDVEFELLLCAVGVGADGPARLEALLPHDIAWDRVVEMAETQKVVPLLYEGLKRANSDLVPEWVMQRLRTYYRANATRCLWLVQELTEILQALEANGIAAMPFKGPALASAAYGSVARRHAGDLDILVNEGDMLQACDIVASRGYALPDQLADMTRPFVRDRCFLESSEAQRVHNMIGPEGIVELHWKFTPRHVPFALVSPDLWRRMNRTMLGGRAVRCLPPEDLLLILCVHGSKHAWSRLCWVCDVAQVVRQWPDMDWAHVQRLAGSLGCRRMLSVGLLLAHQWLGASVPPAVVGAAEGDREAVRLVHEVRRRLSREGGSDPSSDEEYRFEFQMRERVRERALYLCHLLMTPTHEDYEWLPLPMRLSSLYRLLRPLRLLVRAAQAKLGPPCLQADMV